MTIHMYVFFMGSKLTPQSSPPWVSHAVFLWELWRKLTSAVDKPKFMGRPPDHPFWKTGWPKSFLGWRNYFDISLKDICFLVINTKFACFPFNHVPTYRELGRTSGDFRGHVGSPNRVMGRIWRLGDRLSTALTDPVIMGRQHCFPVTYLSLHQYQAVLAGISASIWMWQKTGWWTLITTTWTPPEWGCSCLRNALQHWHQSPTKSQSIILYSIEQL